MRLTLSMMAFAVVLVGCSSLPLQKPGKIPKQFSDDQFTKDQGTPTPNEIQLESDATKVILSVKLAPGEEDSLKLEKEIERELSYTLRKRGVDILTSWSEDESISKKRIDALDTLPPRERLEVEGQSSVDYEIKVDVEKSSFDWSYNEGWLKWGAAAEGSCEYSLKGSLIIDLAPIPSFRNNKRLVVEDSNKFSVNAKDTCPGLGEKPVSNKFSNARKEIVANLLKCSGHAINEYLIPRAYITAFYREDGRAVYSISKGSRAGFKKGDSVTVERFVPGVVGRFDEIATAKVINAQSKNAFVELENHELGEKVNRYDRVVLVDDDFVDVLDRLGCKLHITDH